MMKPGLKKLLPGFVSVKSEYLITVLMVAMLVPGLTACVSSAEVSSGKTAIILCHKTRRTITVPENQAAKHLDHGDTIGACGD